MPTLREKLAAQRIRTVTIDGVEFRLRRPDIRRFLLKYGEHIQPSLQRVILSQRVLREAPETYTAKQLQAEHADFYDFVCLCICDACLTPKLVMAQAEADADPTGSTIWIQELTERDVLDQLGPPAMELLNLSMEDARTVAPFRESADADASGEQLADQPVEAGGQPIVTGL